MESPYPNHSSRAQDPPSRVVRRRNRVPLSCGPCRNRKLKCDRSAPCQNCVRRGDGSGCLYAMPKKKGLHPTQAPPSSPDDMQNRIDRLEGLVLSLMTNGPQSAEPGIVAAALSAVNNRQNGQSQMLNGIEEDAYEDDSDDTDTVTKSFGIMKVDNETRKTQYLAEGHWAVALNDIAEVRNYFQAHKKQIDEQYARVAQTREDDFDAGPSLLFGAHVPPTRTEIMAQIPSRYMADILINRYFGLWDSSTFVLHRPTIRKQYEAHWADPSRTSLVWIALLFGMFRSALLSYERDHDEPTEFFGKSAALMKSYRTAMTNCLILADYTKAHKFIIEALCLHLHCEHRRNTDSEARVWVLVAMIIRFAMKMGYHRDSKMFPSLTPFEGEMRRKVWAYLRSADILFSFQNCLPALVRSTETDTELPRNLHEHEFDEDSVVLPPSRPMTESTSESFVLLTARLANELGKVIEGTTKGHSQPYEEILHLDKNLRETYQDVPEHLKLRRMDEQRDLSVHLIVGRFHLASLYHKGQCTLHRRFLRSGRHNSRHSYSRRTCLESAMAILDFQNTAHRESKGGDQMRNRKAWSTSLTGNDFLLAASIIALDLYLEKRRATGSNASTATSPHTNFSDSNSGTSTSVSDGYGYHIGMEHSHDDLIKALEGSAAIWAELQDESIEAFKASQILGVLITQLRTPTGQSPPQTTDPNYSNGVECGVRGSVEEKQNAAMTLGLLSSGGQAEGNGGRPDASAGNPFDNAGSINVPMQPPMGLPDAEVFSGENGANGSPPFMGMFGVDTGGSMNLDWDAFDNYLQNTNLTLNPQNSLWNGLSPSTMSPFGPEILGTDDLGGAAANSSFNPVAFNANSNNLPPANPGQKFGPGFDRSAQANETLRPDETNAQSFTRPALPSDGFQSWK